MYTIITFIGIIIIIVDGLSRKWFVKGERKKISETEGKKMDRWGSLIIAFIGIIFLFFIIDINDYNAMNWFFVFALVAVLGFQSLMEWKFLEGKKHIATFILMVFSVVAFLSSVHVTEQMKHTSFEEVVLDKININEIDRIDIIRRSDGATVNLREEEQIKGLLGDFSEVQLKQEDYHFLDTYTIRIYGGFEESYDKGLAFTINLIENNYMQVREEERRTRKDGNQIYVVTNQVNYIETLESDELEWEVD